MPITVRTAKEHDIEALSQLATESFVHAYRSTLSVEELLQYCETAFSPDTLKKTIKQKQVIYLIAEDENGIAGYTHLEPLPAPPALPPCTAAVELVRLYTRVGYEGRGIGSCLFKKAIALCREIGLDYIWLQVWEGNKRAQHFYKSFGFESLGTQPYVAKCLERTVVLMGQRIQKEEG